MYYQHVRTKREGVMKTGSNAGVIFSLGYIQYKSTVDHSHTHAHIHTHNMLPKWNKLMHFTELHAVMFSQNM